MMDEATSYPTHYSSYSDVGYGTYGNYFVPGSVEWDECVIVVSEDEDDGRSDDDDWEETEAGPPVPRTTSSQDVAKLAEAFLEPLFEELAPKNPGEEETRSKTANNHAEEIARLKRLIARAEAERAAKRLNQDSMPPESGTHPVSSPLFLAVDDAQRYRSPSPIPEANTSADITMDGAAQSLGLTSEPDAIDDSMDADVEDVPAMFVVDGDGGQRTLDHDTSSRSFLWSSELVLVDNLYLWQAQPVCLLVMQGFTQVRLTSSSSRYLCQGIFKYQQISK